jgi:hypothetical protein
VTSELDTEVELEHKHTTGHCTLIVQIRLSNEPHIEHLGLLYDDLWDCCSFTIIERRMFWSKEFPKESDQFHFFHPILSKDSVNIDHPLDPTLL